MAGTLVGVSGPYDCGYLSPFRAMISNSVAEPFVFGFCPRPFHHAVGKRVTPAPAAVLVGATRNVFGYFAPEQWP